MKKRTSILLAALLTLSSIGATCSKESLVSNAGDVLSSLQSAQPLINQLLPSSAAKIAQAISIATKLKDGIAAGNSASAVTLLSDLIPTFQSIVNQDINQLTAGQKTAVLAALAVADIGLHFLVRNLQKNLPPSAGPKAQAMAAFDAEEVWGNRYKTTKK